jgi:hypothetical protein
VDYVFGVVRGIGLRDGAAAAVEQSNDGGGEFRERTDGEMVNEVRRGATGD